jgi:hypothetical protein
MMSEISMQQLKEQRLTPAEKFVLGKISGARPTAPDVNGRVSWNGKDGEWLYIQGFKNGAIWVSYKYIWSVLEKEYSLSYDEIQQLLTKLLYKYTNNGQLKIKF